ncbi:MAG: hypothetical protein ACR2QO_17955 [Acidimicrobiales bacterium]
MKRSSSTLCSAAFAMVVLLGACAEDQARGDAITEVGTEAESARAARGTPNA